MRFYHFVALKLIARVGYNLCLLGMMLSIGGAFLLAQLGFVVEPSMPTVLCFVAGFIAFALLFITTNVVLNLLLSVKGLKLEVPNSPEGNPVSPSGVWIADDADLDVGGNVLAPAHILVLAHTGWHRAVVVRKMNRNRVWLRFPGWDPFWERPYRKRELQAAIDPHAEADTETSIRTMKD